MKRTLAVLCLGFLFLVGCETAPPHSSMRSENGWKVELCFEKDGHKVYRFSDGYIDWRYYVVPEGTMVNLVPQGKTTRPEEITTVGFATEN